ncbi:MAG: hypothetical protein MJ232_03465 [archaeon]|nr:hypothetical protein [archaeon]
MTDEEYLKFLKGANCLYEITKDKFLSESLNLKAFDLGINVAMLLKHSGYPLSYQLIGLLEPASMMMNPDDLDVLTPYLAYKEDIEMIRTFATVSYTHMPVTLKDPVFCAVYGGMLLAKHRMIKVTIKNYDVVIDHVFNTLTALPYLSTNNCLYTKELEKVLKEQLNECVTYAAKPKPRGF